MSSRQSGFLMSVAQTWWSRPPEYSVENDSLACASTSHFVYQHGDNVWWTLDQSKPPCKTSLMLSHLWRDAARVWDPRRWAEDWDPRKWAEDWDPRRWVRDWGGGGGGGAGGAGGITFPNAVTIPNAVLSPPRMILHSGVQCVCWGGAGIIIPNAVLTPPRVLHSGGQQHKPLWCFTNY